MNESTDHPNAHPFRPPEKDITYRSKWDDLLDMLREWNKKLKLAGINTGYVTTGLFAIIAGLVLAAAVILDVFYVFEHWIGWVALTAFFNSTPMIWIGWGLLAALILAMGLAGLVLAVVGVYASTAGLRTLGVQIVKYISQMKLTMR